MPGKFKAGFVVWLGLSLGLSSCGRQEAAEALRFRQERAQMKQEREAYLKRMVTGQEGAEAIRLVQSSVDPATGRTYKEWAEARLDSLSGNILFPRWEAVRTSPTTYEIWFSCTHVDRENMLSNEGYAWGVNIMQHTVDPPRRLKEEELAAREKSQSGRDREPRRMLEAPELE